MMFGQCTFESSNTNEETKQRNPLNPEKPTVPISLTSPELFQGFFYACPAICSYKKNVNVDILRFSK
jgi:hypothetical protein